VTDDDRHGLEREAQIGGGPERNRVTSERVSRRRYSRRRFLGWAGNFVAGLLAVLSFGYLARNGGTPRGAVTSGAGDDTDAFFAEFPVRSVERVPRVDPERWVVRVDGLVERPLTLDWAAWKALPRNAQTVDFHCVEGWSVGDVAWDGVALATVLAQARPLPEAVAVRFHAAGGTYGDDLTLAQAWAPSVVLADTAEGRPLPPEHGGPLRLVVPDQLAYKSVKWVERLELVAERKKGYWEQRGYPVEAPIPEAQRQRTE